MFGALACYFGEIQNAIVKLLLFSITFRANGKTETNEYLQQNISTGTEFIKGGTKTNSTLS